MTKAKIVILIAIMLTFLTSLITGVMLFTNNNINEYGQMVSANSDIYTELTEDGSGVYVYCHFDTTTIVEYKVWTEYNGQDDIKTANGEKGGWTKTKDNGTSSYYNSRYLISKSDHNFEVGTYCYDIRTLFNSIMGLSYFFDIPQITDYTLIANDNYSYYAYALVSHSESVNRVSFPSWTDKGGGADVLWNNGVKGNYVVGGRSYNYRCTINTSDFNNVRGIYYTDIYAYYYPLRGGANNHALSAGAYKFETMLTLKSGSKTISLTGETGTTVTLPTPTRTGYKFKGWFATDLPSGTYGSLSDKGKLNSQSLYNSDPFFLKGVFGIINYLPMGGVESATYTMVTDEGFKQISPLSDKILKISTTSKTGEWYGGYSHSTQTAAGKEFLLIFQAKIPIGYQIRFGSNYYGDNGKATFYTSRVQGSISGECNYDLGTGDWETYVVHVVCGTTGTFQDTNYIYLRRNDSSKSLSVVYYIANTAVYDVTGKGIDKTFATNMGKINQTYTFSEYDQTLFAMWEPDTWDRYAEEPNKEGDYYIIDTPQKLGYLASKAKLGFIGGKYKMTKNIDLSAHLWYPIGASATSGLQGGEFDGQGYTIYNLKIDSPVIYSIENAGLFGFASWSVFKNVNIERGSLEGPSMVGALVGYMWGGDILYCTNKASIKGNTNYVGGLVGVSVDLKIEGCANYGSVVGYEAYTGGIVGQYKIFNNNSYSIKMCTNTGNIIGSSAVGGIVGEVCFSKGGLSSSMENSLNMSNVTGDYAVGGLIGRIRTENESASNFSITNSGNYDGSKASDAAGEGICNSTIKSNNTSYNQTGGLVGWKKANNLTLSNCFFIGKIEIAVPNAVINHEIAFHGRTDLLSRSNWDDGYINLRGSSNAAEGKYYWNKNGDVGFGRVNSVMGGYPFPRQLFWIGASVPEQSMPEWFAANGYV